RILLGAAVLAHKYVHDERLSNSYWAKVSEIFSCESIGVMERDFLMVVDYDLQVQEYDIMGHHEGLRA
ncbi:hypothetical protein R3P38DRAFT_2404868, partial [Favolaschia claudopus]